MAMQPSPSNLDHSEWRRLSLAVYAGHAPCPLALEAARKHGHELATRWDAPEATRFDWEPTAVYAGLFVVCGALVALHHFFS